jgi:hypothetical protein
MRALPHKNETPGDLGRAGGKYFNFDWHQSYDQNINFQMAMQGRP